MSFARTLFFACFSFLIVVEGLSAKQNLAKKNVEVDACGKKLYINKKVSKKYFGPGWKYKNMTFLGSKTKNGESVYCGIVVPPDLGAVKEIHIEKTSNKLSVTEPIGASLGLGSMFAKVVLPKGEEKTFKDYNSFIGFLEKNKNVKFKIVKYSERIPGTIHRFIALCPGEDSCLLIDLYSEDNKMEYEKEARKPLEYNR